MKAGDVFPSNYLKAEDLGSHEPVVTIDKVTMEKLGDDNKPVLHFRGKDKQLALNKTNFNAIVDITGEDDTDNWSGKKIKLYATKVDYQGKRVPAIRIDAPGTAARQAPAPVETPEEDSIPF